MAQSGFTPIQLYFSATASNVPLAGNLAAGELAINTNDGRLFYKDSSGVVRTIASTSTVTNAVLTTGNQTIGGIKTFSSTIVGSINGNAATATSATNITNAGGWNVTPSGTNLYFNYNGTNVGVLDSSGNLTTIGNITAFGTV
jgi:hypothetical protein